MVLITNNSPSHLNNRFLSKRCLVSSILIGILLLSIPLIFLFFDPILTIANYKLRVDNGTLVHKLLTQRLDGPKLYVHLFNITNGEKFMAGEDDKIKVEEIGPFVYQEYRTVVDLEINKEPGIMRYTPHPWTEFLPEESYGNPEEVFLIMPNIPVLTSTSILSKYPFFIRQMFNLLSSGLKSKSLQRYSVHEYLFALTDPLINLANSVVPGVIYFNSIGMIERYYDPDFEYRMELGTTSADRFQVKSVRKFQTKNNSAHNIVEQIQNFDEPTYEGAIFPPLMNPTMPINIYRHSICKTLKLQFNGTRQMDYGSDAYIYRLHNTTLNDRSSCDSKGWCPTGFFDLAPCFFGFPFAISKGHWLDSDPRLFDKVEGLKPNRTIHDTELIVDPKLGVALTSSMSVQLSLALGDLSFKSETKRFSDMFLPTCHTIIKHPSMLEETKQSLRLIYIYGPYIVLTSQILCSSLGIIILAYVFRSIYLQHKIKRRQGFFDRAEPLEQKLSVKSVTPLIQIS